jgi:hypothetical protein
MSELMIRCPACRGAKRVPKLGGMLGDCNGCEGKGEIKEIDRPKPVIVEPIEPINEVIAAVADAIPTTDVIEDKPVKISAANGRTIYKRKAK